MSPVNISIIIPCFNAEIYIKACIDSILPNLQSGDQVIVIDDGSTDKTSEILRKYNNRNLTIITHEHNIGPSRSRNEGAARATGEIFLFLDVDTEIANSTLSVMRAFFEKNKRIGAVQCELRLSDEKLDSIGHFLTVFGLPYEIGVNEHPDSYQKIIPVFGAKSAGMAVRKKAFQDAGRFDEDYLIYGEDTDLSWRIQHAGYGIKYLPGSIVYHHQKSSMTDKTKRRIYYEGAKNNLNYILKDAPIQTALYMVPLHILCWFMISVKLALQGDMKSAAAVYHGLGWNIVNSYRTLEKRQGIARTKTVQLYGDLNLGILLQKGLRWFIHV